MKKLITLLLSCLVGVPAFAQLVVGNPNYEPFADATVTPPGSSYAPGENLNGQTSVSYAEYLNSIPRSSHEWWLRAGPGSSRSQPTIVSGDLSYGGLYSVGGGRSAAFGPDGDSALMDLSTTTAGITPGVSGTVYWSYVLKLTDLSGLDTNGVALLGGTQVQDLTGNNPPDLVWAAILMVRSDGMGGYNFGIDGGGKGQQSGGTLATIAWDTTSHSVGETVFLVFEYMFSDSGSGYANGDGRIWINPAPSTFGAASAPPEDLLSGGNSTALARIASLVLEQPAGAPHGQIDDVRVGLNWADVTPSSDFVKFLKQPVSLALGDGDDATFNVTADGAPPLSYHWFKDGTIPLSDSAHISGATSNVLTIHNITGADAGSYAVYVTNFFGTVGVSSNADLSIHDPAVVVQPQNQTDDYGTTAIFQVTASGTEPFTYHWHEIGVGGLSDGGNISGSHSNVLALANVAYADQGTFYVTVSNAAGASIDSLTADLVVIDPAVVVQPGGITNPPGATVMFHAVANGTGGAGSFTYFWRKDGSDLSEGGHYSGVFSDTLTISDISSAEAGKYSVVVIGASITTSAAATLAIAEPVGVAIQPRPRALLAGVKAAFSVVASGSGPFTYQWQRYGTNLAGATSSAYLVNDAQTNAMGDYRVVISNSFSSVTSSVAALTVSNNLSLMESNLVIVRAGDGAQTLTPNGSSLFLDQFTSDGTYVNTITIPDAGPTALAVVGWDNIGGVNNGTTTGTSLTRSLDGRFMVVAGYNTNLNFGMSLASSVAANVPRGIGFVDSFGQYTLALASTDPTFDNNNDFWRAAVSDGTNNFWGAGQSPGTYYFGFDQPAAVVQTTLPNIRSMGLFNGDIYGASAAGLTGVVKINGLATTAGSSSQLFTGSSGTYDIAVSPDRNLIYVTDQRATGNGGGIQRWEFNGSTWNPAYTMTAGLGGIGPRYITADFTGANPVLYVTSNDNTFDNNRLIKVVDTGAGSTGTTLAYAGANQTFRGIHFGPVVNTVFPHPRLSFTRDGNNLILSWTGSYTLMSATNVAGPYVDVSGATSPYTNSTASGTKFFGLGQ